MRLLPVWTVESGGSGDESRCYQQCDLGLLTVICPASLQNGDTVLFCFVYKVAEDMEMDYPVSGACMLLG